MKNFTSPNPGQNRGFPIFGKMYSIIDIETTGKSARQGKITEIAIYVFDGEKIVDEYATLVHPEERVTAFITGLTGITNEMLETCTQIL